MKTTYAVALCIALASPSVGLSAEPTRLRTRDAMALAQALRQLRQFVQAFRA